MPAPKAFKKDLVDALHKATYQGGVRGVHTKKAKLATLKYLRKNPSLSNKLATKGVGRVEFLRIYRGAVDNLRDSGIKMRYSKAGGTLESSQKLKTRRAAYAKFNEIKKEAVKVGPLEEKRQETLKTLRLGEISKEREAEAKGAKRSALSRGQISISKYKEDKPVISVQSKNNPPNPEIKEMQI